MACIPIDILAHADFSARHKASRHQPGFGAFGSFVRTLQRQNPKGTLLLSAGDEISSPYWGGEPVIRGMELLGTGAMALGNHEFDHGEAFLENTIASASFPVLCANITRKDTGRLLPGVKPYVLLERNGVKIGVVGITTEYTPYMVTAAAFAPYQAGSCAEACKRYIPEVRSLGADIVVLLAHIPFYIGENGSLSGELIDLLRQIPPVDVCMGGHIPGDYAGLWQDTLVMKGGFGGVSLGHAHLLYDTEAKAIIAREARMELTPWNIPVEPDLAAFTEKITGPHRAFFEDVLAHTDTSWRIRLSRECALGNFLAQALQEDAGVDFAYMNATSSGGGLEPGPITAEDVTMVLGFNDPVMKSTMTGREIWKLFELVYVPERYGNNAGLFFSGVVVHVDHTRPALHKILAVTLPNGTPLDPDSIYTVATSEYMASGGNDTGAIANGRTWTPSGRRMYDVVFASLRRWGTIHVSPEKRLIETGTPENDNAPF